MPITRRYFTSCALCATAGFSVTGAGAQTLGGLTRRILSQVDGPGEGYVTVLTETTLPAGTTVGWHTHPGVESTYIVRGGLELMAKGLPTRKVGLGDGFQIPTGLPHSARNGSEATVLCANFIVRKGEPLTTPVPNPA